MSRISELIEAALDEPVFPPATVEELRRRNVRRRRHRSRVATSLVAIVVAVVVLVFALPWESNTDLGMQISSASVVAPIPKLLSDTVSLDYLPSGFALAQTSIENPSAASVLSEPFLQQVGYTNGVGADAESLLVAVVERPQLFVVGAPLTPFESFATSPQPGTGSPVVPSSNTPETITTTTVGGHWGELVRFDASQPVFALVWLERPGVMLEVNSVGLDLDVVRQVASHLVYRPKTYACLEGSRVISTAGACAPGRRFSPGPLPDAVTVIPGGSLLATGSVAGEQWYLSALLGAYGSAWQLTLGGSDVVQGTWTGQSAAQVAQLSSLGPPDVEVYWAEGGDRYAAGHVPSSVTRVGASVDGSSVSEPVLSVRSDARQRFFVLYLGNKVTECAHLCSGGVTLTFYDGSAIEATIVFSPSSGAHGRGFSVAGVGRRGAASQTIGVGFSSTAFAGTHTGW